jgi:putative phosphoesterase
MAEKGRILPANPEFAMKLAVLSDIHDNVWALQRALDWINAPSRGIEEMILCGDLCSPFVLAMIKAGFSGPIHMVFGNNDGDAFRLTRQADERLSIHGEIAELSWREGRLTAGIAKDGPRVAVNHFPVIAQGLVRSGRYDVVCYGHDHRASIVWYDRARSAYVDAPSGASVLALNPGALMGFNPAPGEGESPFIDSTFAVLALAPLGAEIIVV